MGTRSADYLATYLKELPDVPDEVKKILDDLAAKAKKEGQTLPEIVYRWGVNYLGIVALLGIGGAIVITVIDQLLPGTSAVNFPDIITTGVGIALGALAGLLAAPKS